MHIVGAGRRGAAGRQQQQGAAGAARVQAAPPRDLESVHLAGGPAAELCLHSSSSCHGHACGLCPCSRTLSSDWLPVPLVALHAGGQLHGNLHRSARLFGAPGRRAAHGAVYRREGGQQAAGCSCALGAGVVTHHWQLELLAARAAPVSLSCFLLALSLCPTLLCFCSCIACLIHLSLVEVATGAHDRVRIPKQR